MPQSRNYHSLLLLLSLLMLRFLSNAQNIPASKAGQNQYFSKEQPATYNQLVRKMDAQMTVECAAIGYGGAASAQYARFMKLKSLATDSQLLNLTENGSAIPKAYAFLALVGKKRIDIKSIIENHIKDKAKFSYNCSCITGETKRINEWLLECAAPYLTDFELAAYQERIKE